MASMIKTPKSRRLPLAIAIFAAFGSLLAALAIVKPPIMGDPGPGFVIPEPTPLQFALAAACILTPLVTIGVLLIRPSHPWRTIAIMLATVIGLVDLLAGVVAIVLALLIAKTYLIGA